MPGPRRRWNWRAIRAIMRKDLKQVIQNKMIWVPMIAVPGILEVVLPLVMVLMPSFVGAEEFTIEDLMPILEKMPSALRESIRQLSGQQQWVVLSANYLFTPMFLIVPLMVSSILGADSFAGERERKTLESLLYTPIREEELFVAKLLTGVLSALLVSLGSFVVYGLVVNLSGYRVMGRIFFPTAIWWPLVFWLAPAVAVLGLGATVLISSKAKSFMQAQQLSGALVLPIVFLMIGQVSGLFFLGVWLVLAIGLFVWIIGLWLIWVGAKAFSRDELISRV